MHLVAEVNRFYFCVKNYMSMLTCEEILSIEEYCAKHNVTHKTGLAELKIPFWDFYRSKKRYREEDTSVEKPGQYLQINSGRYVPDNNPHFRQRYHCD